MPDRGPAIAVNAAKRVRVDGLVQGVGFRPFVHRLAIRHQLAGWVLNASGSVEIHVEGEEVAIDRFLGDLREAAPVLTRIETLTALDVVPEGLSSFEVRASASSADQRLPVSPDVAMCANCARELADPANRRFRYPFITCTDCGPRFTVIESMPYDRERTTMRAFTHCPACLREYTTPGDRRYHSETNSCPECGPSLWLERANATMRLAEGDYAVTTAADLLRDGLIVAVRGLGGFQLAVNATDADAVARLRQRKHREAKPLAVMVATLDEARRHVDLTTREAELLCSAAAPIVTCRKRVVDSAPDGALADDVAPGLAHVGIMLAYTPLHVLLLQAAGVPLVMTSGNLSEEPIATGIDEARERLSAIAEAFLLHDREIVARYDDSVLRVAGDAPVFLRRARGYAPLPVDLPIESPRPLLAVGPHLKNTFTLLHGRRAYVSQHVGDLENVETLEHFRAARERFEVLFNIRPEAVVHDRHPGYLSTRIALESGLDPVIAVQHHHAHIAAVLAEHGRTDPVIGVAYDGTGYGDDGNIWGSEIMYADLAGYQRLAHLRYAPLPGGDIAARTPWRVALGYFSLGPCEDRRAPVLPGTDARERLVAERQLDRGINSPLASSMGRLFDAAAAVLGIRYRSRYEGQAAMELEALASDWRAIVLPYRLTSEPAGWVLDPLPLLCTLGTRARAGEHVGTLAAAFHNTIVAATTELVRKVAAAADCRTVALGGGCFQNARLLTSLTCALQQDGFEVLLPRQLSPNDGSVSVGQAAIAAALLAGRSSAARLPRGSTATYGG